MKDTTKDTDEKMYRAKHAGAVPGLSWLSGCPIQRNLHLFYYPEASWTHPFGFFGESVASV
jgi:hypothetical protein